MIAFSLMVAVFLFPLLMLSLLLVSLLHYAMVLKGMVALSGCNTQ